MLDYRTEQNMFFSIFYVQNQLTINMNTYVQVIFLTPLNIDKSKKVHLKNCYIYQISQSLRSEQEFLIPTNSNDIKSVLIISQYFDSFYLFVKEQKHV